MHNSHIIEHFCETNWSSCAQRRLLFLVPSYIVNSCWYSMELYNEHLFIIQTMESRPTVIPSIEVTNKPQYALHWLQGVSNESFTVCVHERLLFFGLHKINLVRISFSSQIYKDVLLKLLCLYGRFQNILNTSN